MGQIVELVAAHRWTGDETCTCACGEDVGNDESWALHLIGTLGIAGYTLRRAAAVSGEAEKGKQ